MDTNNHPNNTHNNKHTLTNHIKRRLNCHINGVKKNHK